MTSIKSFIISILLTVVFSFVETGAGAQCPKSVAWIGFRTSGDFTKIVFQAQEQINADRFCSGERKETRVDSFSVMILRNGEVIFKSDNQGNKFQKEVKAQFSTIFTGDIVLVYNIKGTDYDGQKLILDPLEYHIVDF